MKTGTTLQEWKSFPIVCILLCIYSSVVYLHQSTQQFLTIIKQNGHYCVNIHFIA
jgi:hypothetical protein